MTLSNYLLMRPGANVLEYGSGVSTLLISKLGSDCGLGLKVFSLEESAGFAEIVNGHVLTGWDTQVEACSLSSFDVPASLPRRAQFDGKWYARGADPARRYSLVIVDGPASRSGGRGFERFPAILDFEARIDNDCLIVLDDVSRSGERAVAREWARLLGPNFRTWSDGRAAFFQRGEGMNPCFGTPVPLS